MADSKVFKESECPNFRSKLRYDFPTAIMKIDLACTANLHRSFPKYSRYQDLQAKDNIYEKIFQGY